eukprot:Lithocolla_globosa_v1_NODE_185_length_5387_cov_5.282633.p1 type:complete len:368 gc:universal NODE_185_length_5387_cov_5.282633:1645-542(-)
MSAVRSIQNYTYYKHEINLVIHALSQGKLLPDKLVHKFRFFTLNDAGAVLVYDNRVLVPTEEQDTIIAAAYAKTYAGINRLHSYIMARYLGVKQSNVTAWLARSPVQQQHRHQVPIGLSKPRIVNALNDVWQVHFRQVIILVIVDLWSKFCRVDILPNKQAKTVAASLKRCLSPTTRPKAISSDNGAEFKGAFSDMLQEEAIPQVYGHPGNPTSQASVERLNRTIRMALERFITNGGANWRVFLRDWIGTYNNLKNLSTGFTPTTLQTPSDAIKEQVLPRRQAQVAKLLAKREDRPYIPLQVGDTVRVKILRKNCLEKKTKPEYSKKTHLVTHILKSKYNWDEYKLDNHKIHRRDHLLKIPEDTHSQ